MKEIIYTSHLEFRLEMRRISPDIPRKIFQDSNERYYDSATDYEVAVDRLDYQGREREVMITYDEFDDRIEK